MTFCSNEIPPIPKSGCGKKIRRINQKITGVVNYFDHNTGEIEVSVFGDTTYQFKIFGKALEEAKRKKLRQGQAIQFNIK
jgi:hypothetical protein